MIIKKNKDFGLLFLRVGLGLMFIIHGYPKLVGGVDTWRGIGQSMGNLGITFFPVFWGLMAALAEFFGAICLLLGFFSRSASFALFFTMLVAMIFHLQKGDGLSGASHAIELGIVFFAYLFIGPGKYSLNEKN